MLFKANLDGIGSPPLTRVLLIEKLYINWQSGITPAHAGITGKVLCDSIKSEDHPRSRGYYDRAITAEDERQGSPPLTRVLLKKGYEARAQFRITPAHAGITKALTFWTCPQ